MMAVWWQRLIVAMTALFLTFGIPACLGMRGVGLILAAGLCALPCVVLAMFFVFKVVQPRYVRNWGAVTTLFQREGHRPTGWRAKR
jgi:hypothetical protein